MRPMEIGSWSKRQAPKDTLLPPGFTFVESLVGVAVFMIIAVSVYQAYGAVMNAVRASRLKVAATALANEQFEIIRNLSYDDVGVAGGIPSGKIPHMQNLVRDGTEFTVETVIRSEAH